MIRNEAGFGRRGGSSDARDKALRTAMASLEKMYGRNTVMEMGDRVIEAVPSTTSGSLGLDKALGIGGLPHGRVVEVYGPESSGKTTVALQAIAQVQKEGGRAAFIDAEHALDLTWAKKNGVNVEKLLVSQPDNGEQALDIAEKLVQSSAVDIIVIDSVAALVPKAEIQGEIGDSHVGLQARLMSQALRKLTGLISQSSCTVVFINQIRMKIGVMYGSPETTTGGNALKFYASIRLDIRRTEAIKQGEEAVGHFAKIKVVKNKLAPPFKIALVPIMYDRGFCQAAEAITHGQAVGIVNKSGAWFSIGGEKIGQGQLNATKYLRENPDRLDEVLSAIRKAWAGGVDTTEMSAADRAETQSELDGEASELVEGT